MSWYFNSTTGETKAIDNDLYAAWLGAGNPKALAYALIPDPPAPSAWYDGAQWQIYEPTIEQQREQMVCSKADGQLVLDADGSLDLVEGWIETQPRSVKIEYESRTVWRRDWPLIETARVALGWTHEKVDALFQSAQAL